LTQKSALLSEKEDGKRLFHEKVNELKEMRKESEKSEQVNKEKVEKMEEKMGMMDAANKEMEKLQKCKMREEGEIGEMHKKMQQRLEKVENIETKVKMMEQLVTTADKRASEKNIEMVQEMQKGRKKYEEFEGYLSDNYKMQKRVVSMNEEQEKIHVEISKVFETMKSLSERKRKIREGESQ